MESTSIEVTQPDQNPPGQDLGIPPSDSSKISSETSTSDLPESDSPKENLPLPPTTESETPAELKGPNGLPFGTVLGPMTSRQRLVRAELELMKVPENRMPKMLRDQEVFRSKKSKLGVIKVNRVGGVQPSRATAAMRIFEANVGGKEDVELKLTAISDQLPQDLTQLLHLLRSRPKASLARLVAEAGADPLAVMKSYAEGCVVMGQVQAAIQAHQRLPELVKDLYRHALDRFDICPVCVGSRSVARPGQTQESIQCPKCRGAGQVEVQSKFKSQAMKNLLEMTKQIGQGGGVNVQVNQQTVVKNQSFGGGFMEKMLDLADEILWQQKRQKKPEGEVVEAEVVPPRSN